MAEEWGSIVIKAPADARKAFMRDKDDLPTAVEHLSDFCDADISCVNLAELRAHSITNKAGYIRLDYDGPNWLEFSVAMLSNARNIAYYARHGDEYGTNTYFSLTPAGKKISVAHDLEGDEDNEDILVELGRWVGSLPAALTRAFSDFPLKEDGYIKPGAVKKKSKPKPQVNLYCYFTKPISVDKVQKGVSERFREFEQRKKKTSGGFEDALFSALLGVKQKEDDSDEPEPVVLEWFPICSNRSKTAEDLLVELSGLTSGTIYANNFFGESSFPYRILRCDQDGIEEIFNTDEYTEDELDLLDEYKDQELVKQINWFAPKVDSLEQIHEKYGLRQYAADHIARLKKETEQALQAQQKAHEEIWAEHAHLAVPALKGVKLYYFFQKQDPAEAEASVIRLQQRGMRKDIVERGLNYAGSNSICAATQQKRAAEWIKENVAEMSEHRIVIDDDLDGTGLVINMY